MGPHVTRRIFYDGLNLALEHGTGIATYTRKLIEVARQLQTQIGIVYSTRQTPAKDGVIRDIAFLDAPQRKPITLIQRSPTYVIDHFRCYRPVKPAAMRFASAAVADHFKQRLPAHDYLFAARNLFENAHLFFRANHQLVELAFDEPPDIFHWTYQVPLRARKALNIYTIHDLVPLRLPSATRDGKRRMFRLLSKITATADHIVTVSEHSRRDIIELLGVDERRVTNTYQAVEFPPEYAGQSKDAIAGQLAGAFGLDYQGYLLFFGALEPKKNVGRLIEAYRASGVDLPLVLVASGGWKNKGDLTAIANEPRIRHLDYVSIAMLVARIKGARAVLAPSFYEGFGLPAAEAMMLGNPGNRRARIVFSGNCGSGRAARRPLRSERDRPGNPECRGRTPTSAPNCRGAGKSRRRNSRSNAIGNG